MSVLLVAAALAVPQTGSASLQARGNDDGLAQASLGVSVGNICPHGHFYAYRENLTGVDATFEESNFRYCEHETYHCTSDFVLRMLNHPCRTDDIDGPSTRAVTVLHVFHRYAPTRTRVGIASRAAFDWSMGLLGRLPQKLRDHHSLYLFSGGEAYNMGHFALQELFPKQATIFTPEPLWAQQVTRDWRSGSEPAVPTEEDACYLYQPSTRYASVPYWQPDEQPAEEISADLNRPSSERSLRVFYFGSLHGQAAKLRERLYDLCETGWSCPREGAVQAHRNQGRLPLTHAEYMQSFGQSTFVLIPAGDSPGRISMWDGLRRGAVPVLFSSCPHSHILDSHRGWLPANAPGFGVGTWAVLLNQTAVMTSATYLRDTLAAVSDEQIHSMRAVVRTYIRKISYDEPPHATSNDALALTVDHMLQRRRGSPELGPPMPPNFSTVCSDGLGGLRAHTPGDC